MADIVKISELAESTNFANLYTIGSETDGQGEATSKKVSLANLANVGNKVDKVAGKGLSTNDYTDTDKAKVATAYQKPSSGIPASDLASGVIPDNPPYLSLERLRPYLYRVTFDAIPQDNGNNAPVGGGCSAFVQNGKLLRNYDFNYDNAASFIVRTKDFEGMAMITGLNDGQMDDELIAQLPYRMVDGRNNDGIMVSVHLLFNDWHYTGAGSKSIPMTSLPFEILSRVKSMATITTDLADVLGNLNVTSAMGGYLLQCLVTDGTTTYAVIPPDTDNTAYTLVDATTYPKMSNFRYVARAEVARTDTDIQTRPTGIERFNMMPCELSDLRFTKAYEAANRLSEFIGIDDTTKASTDEELTAIYNEARAEYLVRERDGVTWQTMHSVVYGDKLESLWIQENWEDNVMVDLSGYAKKTEIPTISTDIEADKTSNTKTASPKAVYDALQGTGGHSPYIGTNGNWFEWDVESGEYVDTNVHAQGPQGEQGNTGSSVDYPFELVNNLTTDDATKALSAAQGKVLKGLLDGGYLLKGIAHPDDAVVSPTGKVFYFAFSAGTYTNKGGFVKAKNTLSVICFDGTSWSMQDVMAKSIQITLPDHTNGAYITSSLTWSAHTPPPDGVFLPVTEGEKYHLKAVENNTKYSFLTHNRVSRGSAVSSFVSGTSLNNLSADDEIDIVIPTGCTFLHFNGLYDTVDHTPIVSRLYDIDIFELANSLKVDNKDIVLDAWIANHKYVIGKQIQVSNKYYRCSTAHTSGETFNVSDGWTEITDFVNGGENYVQTIWGNPIFQSILKIDKFDTIFGDSPVGTVMYHINNHTLRLKGEDSNNKTIPYSPNALYLYENELYVWNGAELVKFIDWQFSKSVTSAIVSSYIRADNGGTNSNTGYHRTDYLSLFGVNSLIIENGAGNSGTALIAYYDKNKTFISSIPYTGLSNIISCIINKTDFPNGAAYVRLCHHINVDSEYKLKFNWGQTLGDDLEQLYSGINNVADIQKSIADIPYSNRNIIYPIVADGSAFVHGPKIKLEAGKKYRIILSNPSFSHYATSNTIKLGIYSFDDLEGTNRVVVQTWGGTVNIPFYYDILVNENYPYYDLGSRCNVGETLTAVILPIDALGEPLEKTSILALNPKSEFEPKFRAAKKRYYTSTDTTEKPPIVITHLSDIHGNWVNVSRFLDFCTEYSSFIDLLLNTGDTVSSQFSDGIAGYDAITGVSNIVNVIGNHDTRGTDDWQAYAGTQDAYDRYYANVASWGVTQPSGIGVDGYYPCYCYKDFADQKLRIIFLDVMAYDATEDTWLQSVLEDAITNEYHVVVAAHMAGFMPNNSDITAEHIDCNWTSFYGREPITASQTNGYNPYAYHMIESVDAFIADGGIFVGYLCGHSHYDFIAKKGTDNKQWIYTIGASKAGEMRDYNHVVGTRNQDEFQIVSIDTHLGIIKLFKVGANVDLYGRHKNSICIDYINHTIKAEAY